MKPVVKIHTNKLQRARNPQTKTVTKTAEWQRVFVDFSKFLIIIIVAASLFGLYTYLNSNIQKTAKEITKYESQIKNIDREIENYTIAITELKSWRHINNQITRFDMKLQLPQAGQKQYISLIDSEELKVPYAKNSENIGDSTEIATQISMK